MSENKTSKYFKYAIGEIILVVIGILIALQINNWNENRKSNRLLKQYTSNLIQDLEKDKLDITTSISKIKEDSTALYLIQQRVINAISPLDTLYKIARYDFQYYISGHDDFNNDTFQVLNSTGDLSLFDTDIINDLNDLNNIHEKVVNRSQYTIESYIKNAHNYVKKYPLPFEGNLFPNGSKAADLIWEQISLSEHATIFNSLVIAKGDSYRLSLIYLPQVLEKTNDLLEKLEKIEAHD
ncbi:DUF6090 family protein [Hanstruepera marina]|uniref:DUF6090 family protein n=1 Tax=Hanstruepera marina TaxID=2873265 RepID=UPI001CA7118E|nr:DUF6090 family protein [Hanstruepera marina]